MVSVRDLLRLVFRLLGTVEVRAPLPWVGLQFGPSPGLGRPGRCVWRSAVRGSLASLPRAGEPGPCPDVTVSAGCWGARAVRVRGFVPCTLGRLRCGKGFSGCLFRLLGTVEVRAPLPWVGLQFGPSPGLGRPGRCVLRSAVRGSLASLPGAGEPGPFPDVTVWVDWWLGSSCGASVPTCLVHAGRVAVAVQSFEVSAFGSSDGKVDLSGGPSGRPVLAVPVAVPLWRFLCAWSRWRGGGVPSRTWVECGPPPFAYPDRVPTVPRVLSRWPSCGWLPVAPGSGLVVPGHFPLCERSPVLSSCGLFSERSCWQRLAL
jgi:hypothetical protein